MTYELAKELKEAGFPKKWCYREGMIEIPTLSELIQACNPGVDFILDSTRLTVLWYAECRRKGVGHGSTPEEAVAKLWLTLNRDTTK